MNGERIQKVLARAGIGSRRAVEELIKSGRILVNKSLAVLGQKITPHDLVYLDNTLIDISPFEKVYLMLNKPRKVLVTLSDPQNRTTISDFIPSKYKDYHLFPVGRLDYETSGLIFLTNDGDFMQKITGPRSEIEKEYLVKVKGKIKNADLDIIRSGLIYKSVKYRPANLVLLKSTNEESIVKVIIKEGKNREVRNFFQSLNKEVLSLERLRIGPVKLGMLSLGEVKHIKMHDVKILRGENGL